MSTNVTVTLVLCACPTCGHLYGLPEDFYETRRRDHGTWYCPYCRNAIYFPQQSAEERLKRKLAAAEREADTWRETAQRKERQRRAAKAAKTRALNRVRNGVCPFCQRSFQNLKAHMDSKHGGEE